MRIRFTLGLIVLAISLTSCGSSKDTPADADADGRPTTDSSVTQGDFTYRLVTSKPEYQHGEHVSIYAELTYVGNEPSVTIDHSDSPFYFPIQERTRNYAIDYAISDVGASTTLVHGEPLRGSFDGGGAYGGDDRQAYKDFIEDYWKNGFPKGYYEVNGFADFSVSGQRVKIGTRIDFIVGD
ncbi:hypothetical protein [Paenibacillus sacheonensis]|uniref:Uncharacterized protein n=1 Tax=Paenibacillus sacheonensis TaxID=742054 RepID=A0A7X5BXI4_9BACL|nr:hypothetical protein [Paenibacillus sacheonensis]MBM7566360.1 hypothetical protein [Paenibacillus sacheonensis]NBC70563.1 hypothetical protein [Paenibacillus sacheonensis]